MSDLESQLWVNTLFRGRQMAEFLAVKKHLGIQSNTDVVRHLVHRQARILRRLQRSSPPLAGPPPGPLQRAGQERAAGKAGQPSMPSDLRSLCLSCPLPECDETDPRCPYRQAAGKGVKKDRREP